MAYLPLIPSEILLEIYVEISRRVSVENLPTHTPKIPPKRLWSHRGISTEISLNIHPYFFNFITKTFMEFLKNFSIDSFRKSSSSNSLKNISRIYLEIFFRNFCRISSKVSFRYFYSKDFSRTRSENLPWLFSKILYGFM